MNGQRGIKNYLQNIKPTMLKLKDGERLLRSEEQSIVEFYLEVNHFISEMEV